MQEQTIKTTGEILRWCEETLITAKFGLEDVKNRPERRNSGFRNLVVFGRAVTNVLQNLRSTETGFDDWYRPYQQEMAQDPLMKYFYEMRSEILKEGTLRAGNYAH